MTKEEAIIQMRKGKKITHKYFSSGEWMTIKGSNILLEDGVVCDFYEFWNDRFHDGWKDGYEFYGDQNIENMTKEELAVKIFQRSKSRFVKESARKAIENNTEDKFIDDVLISINEHKAISDWYTHMLGEDLYAELQKFKTEKE